MQMISVNKLNPHPKNNYFFDDMSGEAWMAFIESVETSGIIEPIVVTQDLTIVSGHQRVRACKELKIKEILAETRVYESEDEVLKQLIETNIRQRGVGNTNPVKFGRCIRELERIYGIKQGNNQHTQEDANNVRKQSQKTQSDLADEIGVDVKTLQNAKRLASLPEEIQQMVMDGKVTASTASRVIARMSPEEQEQLAEQIRGKDKVSSRDVEFYKKRIQKLTDENAELRNRQPEIRTVEKVVEVAPEDYEDLKRSNESSKKEYESLRKEYDRMADKWKQAEHEKRNLLDEMHRPENEKAENIKRSALFFCAGVANFIEKYGGYVWLAQELDNMEKAERDGYIKAIDAVYAWASQMKENVGR